ncbi:MAG: acylneuraminate cytidylyltransferase family protein [Rhizobiaceae bacterium]
MTPSGRTAFAIIPARGGSKGLLGKNTRPLAGYPLISWSIAVAHATGLFDAVIVTTDSEEIGRIAKRFGALTCRRPPELASDTALVKDAVRHCLEHVELDLGQPNYLVLLQPTSPLRKPGDIVDCITAMEEVDADSATSFRLADEPIERAYRIENGHPVPAINGQDNWLPRQLLPDYYYLNGAVYVVRTSAFLSDPTSSFLFGKQVSSIMPSERSIDIDTASQFRLAELMMSESDYIKPVETEPEPPEDRVFDYG